MEDSYAKIEKASKQRAGMPNWWKRNKSSQVLNASGHSGFQEDLQATWVHETSDSHSFEKELSNRNSTSHTFQDYQPRSPELSKGQTERQLAHRLREHDTFARESGTTNTSSPDKSSKQISVDSDGNYQHGSPSKSRSKNQLDIPTSQGIKAQNMQGTRNKAETTISDSTRSESSFGENISDIMTINAKSKRNCQVQTNVPSRHKWPWQDRAIKSEIFGQPSNATRHQNEQQHANPTKYSGDQKESITASKNLQLTPKVATCRKWPYHERTIDSHIFSKKAELETKPTQPEVYPWDQRKSFGLRTFPNQSVKTLHGIMTGSNSTKFDTQSGPDFAISQYQQDYKEPTKILDKVKPAGKSSNYVTSTYYFTRQCEGKKDTNISYFRKATLGPNSEIENPPIFGSTDINHSFAEVPIKNETNFMKGDAEQQKKMFAVLKTKASTEENFTGDGSHGNRSDKSSSLIRREQIPEKFELICID